jgi:hypothetical protein
MLANKMIFLKNRYKKDNKYYWTNHALQKMAFYRLSEGRIKKILRSPHRVERGIAPDTTASMQRNDTKKRKEEIWVMWNKNVKCQKSNVKSSGKIIIISAWRYPGISPVGKKIEIPEDVLADLRDIGLIQ